MVFGPYVYAPLPFEFITFLAFTHFPLPLCLSDSVVRSGSCLTLTWAYGLTFSTFHLFFGLGIALVQALSFLPGPYPLLSYVCGLPAANPAMLLHCSYYIIISILFPCYLWAYRPMLLPVHFPHLFFFWALFDHIPAMPAHFIPWASSAYLLLLYLFYSHVFLLNLLGFLSPTNTSLPHITFRAYWPLNQPYKFTNSYLGLPGPFTSFLLLIIPIDLLLLHS